MTELRSDSLDALGIAAGPFGAWLVEARASLRGASGADVPCGDCVGCCVSSYFIPIRPEDTAARAVIPPDLLVAAPGQQSGHAMMGYLADGTCPMLNTGKCTIYRSRPQTCRDYDCRIFAAAGIAAGGADKSVINRRVLEWRFDYATEADQKAHKAVQSAAAFIRDQRASFPGGRAPTAPTGIAVLALKVYALFLDVDAPSKGPFPLDSKEMATNVIKASREFDTSLT